MMPAGTYYIGDLCYVMHPEWEEVCQKTIQGNECLSGEFQLADGRRFAMYRTAYGDGSYPNTFSNMLLPVDSGTIGCIRVDDISERESLTSYGIIVTFDKEFATSAAGGDICFGQHTVMTSHEEIEDDDWLYEEE